MRIYGYMCIYGYMLGLPASVEDPALAGNALKLLPPCLNLQNLLMVFYISLPAADSE